MDKTTSAVVCERHLSPGNPLCLRQSTFCKSRLLPLHETAQVALERYVEYPLTLLLMTSNSFRLEEKPLLLTAVETAFRTTVAKIGLRRWLRLPRPAPHSLRHTFAVRVVSRCSLNTPVNASRFWPFMRLAKSARKTIRDYQNMFFVR